MGLIAWRSSPGPHLQGQAVSHGPSGVLPFISLPESYNVQVSPNPRQSAPATKAEGAQQTFHQVSSTCSPSATVWEIGKSIWDIQQYGSRFSLQVDPQGTTLAILLPLHVGADGPHATAWPCSPHPPPLPPSSLECADGLQGRRRHAEISAISLEVCSVLRAYWRSSSAVIFQRLAWRMSQCPSSSCCFVYTSSWTIHPMLLKSHSQRHVSWLPCPTQDFSGGRWWRGGCCTLLAG